MKTSYLVTVSGLEEAVQGPLIDLLERISAPTTESGGSSPRTCIGLRKVEVVQARSSATSPVREEFVSGLSTSLSSPDTWPIDPTSRHVLLNHGICTAYRPGRADATGSRGGPRCRRPPAAASLAKDAAETADATADPAWAARGDERLGLYLMGAGRIEEALDARANAVKLVPAHPPTPLRARVTAAMAQALIQAWRRDEARRWCDEALVAARGAGSTDDEADVLITLGVIEIYDDPAKARSLYAAGRARAVDAGNPLIELRALLDLAALEGQLGNLAAACAAVEDGAKLAQRTGLSWSRSGIDMRSWQFMIRYLNGDWDESERLAAAIPELVTTLTIAELAADGLAVQVARGRSVAARRLRHLAALAGVDHCLDKDVAVREAELATWQGDLDRAKSAIQRALPPPTRLSTSNRRWRLPGCP